MANNNYYASNDVEVFPSAWRTKMPNGKFTSENNFVNIINSLIDIKSISGGSDGFVVYHDVGTGTSQTGPLAVVIHGYYFEIKSVEKVKNLWLGIHVGESSESLLPYGGEEKQKTALDDENEFLGLVYFEQESKPSVSDSGYYFLNVYNNGKLNKTKFITDSIYYGNGDRSLTDELDAKQYELKNGQGIEKISNKFGENEVKLTDEEYNKLTALASTTSDKTRLVYFDDKGLVNESSEKVGGFTDGDNKVINFVYLEDGKITSGPSITFSSNNPSGGKSGDIWFKYSN